MIEVSIISIVILVVVQMITLYVNKKTKSVRVKHNSKKIFEKCFIAFAFVVIFDVIYLIIYVIKEWV